MRTQRAHKAVKSNKGKRTVALDEVCTYEYTFHETHVGVELIRSAGTCMQICSSSRQGEICHSNEPFEVENNRGVAPFRVHNHTTLVRPCCGTVHGSGEIEVAPWWWWNIDMWNRYRKIAESGCAAGCVLCTDFAGNTRAQ